MKIRIATRNDIAKLKELDTTCAEADVIDGKKFYVLDKKGIIPYFLKYKGLIVAEDNGMIVGFALSHIAEWMHGVDRLAWIEHIGVHPEHRKKGVAMEMLKFIEKHYRSRAKAVFATIHPLNKKSMQLFGKFGADSYERVMAFKDLK